MQAIILKKNVFSEGNEIVTLYSRELGKVRGVARAVKKPLSKLAFGLQTLFYSEVETAKARRSQQRVLTITGAKPLNTYKNLRESAQAVNAALFGAEVILKSSADEQPNPELFDYFQKFLAHLDQHAAEPHLCWIFFGWHVLGYIGYKIDVENCASCGKPLLTEENQQQSQYFFSNRKGGFVCANCALKTPDAGRVSQGSYGALKRINASDFNAQDQSAVNSLELRKVAISFIEHTLERDLKSGKFMV